ncbi:hypothetical protein Tamer19_68310 [Cupriavidus sp. TA19]|nr:hypothetical protein Tamer19_68310 [Cupriavidus sp. TA19]
MRCCRYPSGLIFERDFSAFSACHHPVSASWRCAICYNADRAVSRGTGAHRFPYVSSAANLSLAAGVGKERSRGLAA